jgi:hypothetical protein
MEEVMSKHYRPREVLQFEAPRFTKAEQVAIRNARNAKSKAIRLQNASNKMR